VTLVELLVDAFGRVHELVPGVVDGLDGDALAFRPASDANSIGWLVWHLTRIQDDHVAHLAGVEQAWTARGWADRFALPFDTDATGYGQTSDQVAAVRPGAAELLGYHEDVHVLTIDHVTTLDAAGLERVVDRRWDPPVTAGVRLVSVVSDTLQHLGQAAYVRGLLA
jgi:hypothetical protein